MNTTNPVVVYIDDQPQNLALFEATCPEDWKVYTFDDPAIAIETLANERITPWVVLSDQRMPGKSGFEALEQIMGLYPYAARIIVTAYSDETALIESVRKAKVYDYIKKPWDPDLLEASIRKGMAHYQLQVERTQLLEELQSSQLEARKLAAFAEHAPTLIMSINAQGQIAYINPYGQRELNSAGLSKDTAAMLLPLPVDQLVEQCIVQGKSIPGLENQYSDKTYLWVFSPVAGQPLLHGYALNISELVQARARANQVEVDLKTAEQVAQHKSQFLAAMSHEIRTPLTAINGFGETLLDHDISSAERFEAANAIVRNGTHLLHILNDILDMSKVEAGKLQVECISFSLFEFMADIHSFIGKQATSKGLDFSIDFQFPLPEKITTDPLRLKQVLLNLGGNAVKFTSNGSIKIAVHCDLRDNTMSFEFIDTGVGLTQDQQSKLFSPFTQADSSTTRHYGGTGLGLHLSKRLTELLGGTITLRSEPGVGSKFKATIDSGCVEQSEFVHTFPDVAKNTAPIPSSGHLSPLGGRVLLADDNPDNQRLISLFVRKMGLALTVVENGEQAVQRATTEDFDVILMDMQMPVMDGLTAVKILRGKNYAKPIIALTANVMKHDCELYAAAGCNDYIAKPLSRDWLYKVLARYLPMSAATASPICSLVLIEEPEVEDIVQRFVQGLHVTQEKIRRGAREENWAELKHIFHDIKGTGSSMGYPMLTELAQRMELHLMQGEYREMGECYVHFDAMCDRIYTGIRKVERV